MSDEHTSRGGEPPLLPELQSNGPPAPETAPPVGPPAAAPPQTAPEDGEPAWTALLHNRLLLGGAAFVAVLVLIALVLFAIGRGEGPVDTETVAGASTPDPAADDDPNGVFATIRTTTSMRNGPGDSYPILGTIPRDAEVSVVGRNEDRTWLQIVWPPGSSLRGWIDVTFAEVTGDIEALAVAGPGEGPSIDVPTSSGPVVQTPVFVATPTATQTTPEQETVEPTRTRQPTRPLRTAPPTHTPMITPAPPQPTATPLLNGVHNVSAD